MLTLQKLDIHTQKDEIIARLLLQRFYGTKLNGMYSKNEINHILKHTTPDDSVFYDEAYNAVKGCKEGTDYLWLVGTDEGDSF